MKRRINIYASRHFPISIFIFLLTIVSCRKDEIPEQNLKCPVVAVNGADDNILGKWKLVNANIVFSNPRTEDYSCDEIIYDFRADGILVVSSGASGDSVGHQQGQYTYAFTADRLFEGIEESYTLSINETKIASGIKNNKLVLNDSPLDGPILYFVRIQ